jgi:peptidyl-prolyl cis-trans isomerase C
MLNRRPMNRRPAHALLFVASLLGGCDESSIKAQQQVEAGPPIAGLNAQDAARVIAKVGDRSITLGDYAKTLERIDPFDRLRFQTKERRRELLSEIINIELLASEAKRRGLDKEPETEDAVRTILRDAMLADARADLPAPAEIPAAEVRAYFDANIDRFSEPERRRVAAVVMTDKKEAQKVLKDAQKVTTGAAWGDLFAKSSITAPKGKNAGNPAELAGDLGIVGPMSDVRGANPRVPDAVRAAVFTLGAVGAIGPELVEAEGKLFIVRLNGITPAHHRTLAESERSIRVFLLQERMLKKERDLEAELRKKYPVQIDEQALAKVKIPDGMDRWFAMDSKMWPDESAPPGSAPPGGEGPAAGVVAPPGPKVDDGAQPAPKGDDVAHPAPKGNDVAHPAPKGNDVAHPAPKVAPPTPRVQ